MNNSKDGGRGGALATDLDGTLIPLDGCQQHQLDLRTLSDGLQETDSVLAFSTGRHFESVLQAIEQFHLPLPDWILCDVGSSIFQRTNESDFKPFEPYQRHLEQLASSMPIVELRVALQAIDGLQPQEEDKQGRFKLSYYADADLLDDRVREILTILERTNAPYSIVQSIDPFNGDGLIDLLPAGVSKAYALDRWCEHLGLPPDRVVFAGDSGNDLAALTSGCRAVVVGNADRSLARKVYESHRQNNWRDRLFLAAGTATTGVLEGCRWFGLTPLEANLDSYPVGATLVAVDQTHFRVWAPKRKRVEVDLQDQETRTRHELTRSEFGYFCGTIPGVRAGSRYQYVLDRDVARPDPASRYQPDGVHEASEVVSKNGFPWSDQHWHGIDKRDLVIYELHIGAFTESGTLSAATDRIDEFVDLGITAIEIMPVAQSPGRWNWGYDGVNLFAVRNSYGYPDDFKAFVDACHARGIAVLLDVVYNHLGPEGNYLSEFGPYFSKTDRTPWGESFNFDGRHSSGVRNLIVENALYWLEEFHLDGLRIDAIHFMPEKSRPSVVDELRTAVTAFAGSAGRHIHLIGESNLFDIELLSDNAYRQAFDAIWCDCFMHSVYAVAAPELSLTSRDYKGAADIDGALRRGFVFSGRTQERYSEDKHRTAPLGDSYFSSLVIALQTHDSVGNHPHGKRLHHITSKAFQKAAASLALLAPSIPMLFMGEEVAIDAPFPFFADFQDHRLRTAVDRGRTQEYAQHDWRNTPLPSAEETFYSAKCDQTDLWELDVLEWYRSLIALRKRGLAEGWLAASKMTCEHDASVEKLTLTYLGEGCQVSVHARLSPPTDEATRNPVPLLIPPGGKLVMSSEPSLPDSRRRIELLRNHAVIIDQRKRSA